MIPVGPALALLLAAGPKYAVMPVMANEVVSEKSALGTNSVPSRGTIATAATRLAIAIAVVAPGCASDQRSSAT